VAGNEIQDDPNRNAPKGKTEERGYEAFLRSLRRKEEGENAQAPGEARRYWQHPDWRQPKTVIEIITLGGIAAYTIITFKLLSVSQGQLRQSERAFRIDERAWVQIRPITRSAEPPSPGFEHLFRYEIFPQNFGKTVARRVVINAGGIGSGEDFTSDEEGIAAVQDQELLGKFVDQATGKFVKSRPAWVPQTLAPSAIPLAPFILLGSAPKMYPDGHWLYSYLIGRIDYVDAFDVSHWLKFCVYVAGDDGSLRNCQYGNEDDNNPE
jgi:hypothetical protein